MRHIADNLKAWIQRSNETMIELIAEILAMNVCIAIVGGIISGNILRFCLGVLLGTVYAVFAVIHMTTSIEDALDLPQDAAEKSAKRGYGIRLVIAGIVMIIGLEVTYFHFAGVFLAMMSVKFSALLNPWMHRMITKIKGKGR